MIPYALLKLLKEYSFLFSVKECAQLKSFHFVVIFFLIPIQAKVIIKLTNKPYCLISRKYSLGAYVMLSTRIANGI